MKRGEVYWADLVPPAGPRPVLVVGRESSLRRGTRILVAPVTTHIRDLESDVVIEPREGIRDRSAAQCGSLLTIDRASSLREGEMETLADALRYALDVRCPPL
jgi:mRNA-degrading endonuclease toxin of MazEF toxin-antitoxin module